MSDSNVSIDYPGISAKTIPQLFTEKVQKEGGNVAFYHKNLGIYEGVTWRDYREHVQNLCLGLLELGLERGDCVAIMADPCPEWFYADIASMSAGAISYGIHTTCSPDEVAYLVESGAAKFFVAGDQEYVDKILTFIDRCPRLQKIIVADTRAMFAYNHPKVMSFVEVEELGKQRKDKEADCFEKLTGAGKPDEIGCLIYTSGAGGKSIGTKATHRNLVARSCALLEIFPRILTHEHRVVNHLSFAHPLERDCCLYAPLLGNITPFIGEGSAFLQTLYEVQPNLLQGLPRIWEKLAAQLVINIHSSSRLKRKSYQWAVQIGRPYRTMNRKGKGSVIWSILYWTTSQAVFRRILTKAGLSKIKYALSAGAPLSPDVQSLWQIWGVDMLNCYTSTEAGCITSQRPGFPQAGDAGEPTSIGKVRLADDGEVLISGAGVIGGYWHDDEETRISFENGWFHTGDIGQFDNGRLKIIASKRNVIKTSGGRDISPTAIELALKASPYISEAILFGDQRPFLSALIEINYDGVSEWARNNKVLHTGFTSLATQPDVYRLIASEIEGANRQFDSEEQVKQFRIIPKELGGGEEYMTPTRKIKRERMYELFKSLVEGMYESEEEKG